MGSGFGVWGTEITELVVYYVYDIFLMSGNVQPTCSKWSNVE